MASREDVLRELARRELESREAPPIPAPTTTIPQRPRSLSEATGGVVTPELAAGLTGVVGTAAALPSAAVSGPVGPAAGGLLGAMGGRFAYENLEDFLGRAGYLDRPETTLSRMGELAQEEMTAEALAQGVGGLARPLLATRVALGKILGVGTERANQLINLAKQGGLVQEGRGAAARTILGAADVGSNIARGTARALSVFPFTGTPALRNLSAKEAAVERRVNSLLNELAPNALLRNELGMEIMERSGRRFRAFKRLTGRLADNLDTVARQAGREDIVPTETVRQQANEFLGRVARGEVELISGDKLSDPAKNRILEWAQELTELPELLTIDQYRETVRKLGGLLDEVEGEIGRAAGQFREGSLLKSALETDLQNIGTMRLPSGEGVMQLLPKEEADAIQSALRAFNRAYSKGMQGFQTATARRVARGDPSIFRTGPSRGGTLSPDEVSDVVGNLRSREAVKELEFLIGKGAMRDAGRSFIDNALRTATEQREIAGETVDVVDINKFVRNLGLEGKQRLNREALDEFFKRSGGNLDDFEALMTAARSIERFGDPSTFVLRRTILGGVPAMAGAAGAGAAVGAGAGRMSLGAIGALTLLFRKASDIVTSPVALENMRIALQEGIQPSVRRQALARVLTAITRSEANKPESGDATPRAVGPVRTRVSPPGRIAPTSSRGAAIR